MDRASIEHRVRSILGAIAKRPPDAIDSEASVGRDLGLSSLDNLELRESLERAFSIYIPDTDVECLDTLSSIVNLVEAKSTGPQGEARPSSSPGPELRSTTVASDTLNVEFEIGMPHTGRNNLCEHALLRELGHLRWQHITAVTGVASRDVVDEQSERLYPTFFYAELGFPDARPMSGYKENDVLTVAGTLHRFGRSILDGTYFLFPGEWPAYRKAPYADPRQALQDGVGFVRLSNIFVKQWRGAGWLKQSRPAHPGFDRIAEIPATPDSHDLIMQTQEHGTFLDVPDGYVPLTAGELEVRYDIVPDRDLNGAGLLYFANYPVFLDIAERQVLGECGALSLSEDLIDRRTLQHRHIGYYSNAMANERLRIGIQAWLENPFLDGATEPRSAPIRLLLNYRMQRESDGRLMLISSAKKVITGATLGDSGLLDALASG